VQAKRAIRKPPVTIAADATIADAADLMNREVVGAVVVVDHDHPIGIVTDRDLVVRGLVRRVPLDARIDSVMTGELVTLPADADLHEAMALFRRHPIRRLPLLEDGRMIGMITVDDVAIDLVSELDSLFRPVVGQVIFGAPEREEPLAVPSP
jgi:signal-transduction protein with cAMP-binding, CBS, and nucleotidyltransferase domain